jgi:hypothetical protein
MTIPTVAIRTVAIMAIHTVAGIIISKSHR